MTMYRYSVKYRRDNSVRVWHLTVTASGPDEARRVVASNDPHYLSTVASPRRGARILVATEAHA